MNETDLLTTKEAAEKLGISLPRIHQLVSDGRLPSIKMGRDLFIRKTDLKLVQERKTGRPRSENPSPAALAKRKQREKGK